MDSQSRREWIRAWIALGVREGLTFKELAKRSGLDRRTLSRWNAAFRKESAQKATPDREEHAFVELVERSGSNSSRIEVVLPGERRIVVDGSAIVEALVRVITAVQQC